ncbi:hypothetical protein MNVI_12980 [Mycobacterium noviomagense]|uniref:Uncharacterized protein n=1 Tax=Mycobacterium noviomagense TaxID=459858 RepID=A0A7I7PBJ6_9MYCO|nr:hypothetical protein MNVI_12980 [Mycobacterium noviomagense]
MLRGAAVAEILVTVSDDGTAVGVLEGNQHVAGGVVLVTVRGCAYVGLVLVWLVRRYAHGLPVRRNGNRAPGFVIGVRGGDHGKG